jgi:hypothetical protein
MINPSSEKINIEKLLNMDLLIMIKMIQKEQMLRKMLEDGLLKTDFIMVIFLFLLD